MKKNSPWWWKAPDQSPAALMDLCLLDPEQEVCEPGDGLFTKFDLLPTPPRSPSRPDEDDDFHLVTEPSVDLVSDLLDMPALRELFPTVASGLKNDLLHDCMWSGQCTDACKKGHALGADVVPEVTPEGDESSRSLTPSPTLPVDPCTMLPYTPLSDHSYHTQQQQQQQQQQTPKFDQAPMCDTPSDTEDDEIDVVTLPASVGLKCEAPESPPAVSVRKASEATPSVRRRPPGRPPTVPPLRVVIPASVYAKERRGPRKRFQKRQASESSSSSGWTRRQYKRRLQTQQDRTVSCSSDSEDCVEKRSMHNSMERKRRDDLRYAFQTLRENVPELSTNPKAPKVLILNRAAAFARHLGHASVLLEKAYVKEKKKQAELERRLHALSNK